MPRKRETTWPKTITYPVDADDLVILDLIKRNRPLTVKTGVEAIREVLQDYKIRYGLQPEGKGGKDADLKEIKEATREILRAVQGKGYSQLDRKLWLFLINLRDRLAAGDVTDMQRDLNFWISIMEPSGEDG